MAAEMALMAAWLMAAWLMAVNYQKIIQPNYLANFDVIITLRQFIIHQKE